MRQPVLEGRQNGYRHLLSSPSPCIRWLTADRLLHLVQLADESEGFNRERTRFCLVDVIELASHMRHAGSLPAAVGIQGIESSEAIGMDDAAEVAQMVLRMLPLPVRRIGKPDRRRGLTLPWL